MQATIHGAILRQLRHLNDADQRAFLAEPDEVVLRALFLNYRSGRGIRLTSFGLSLLAPLGFHYEIKLTSVRASDIAQLESRLTMPYFVDAERIVFFKEEDAVLLRLTQGDLRLFVQNT